MRLRIKRGWCGSLPKSGIIKRAAIRKKRLFAFKERHKAKGGALDGHTLLLSTPGTLVFTLNGMKGFYNHKMEWVGL